MQTPQLLQLRSSHSRAVVHARLEDRIIGLIYVNKTHVSAFSHNKIIKFNFLHAWIVYPQYVHLVRFAVDVGVWAAGSHTDLLDNKDVRFLLRSLQ